MLHAASSIYQTLQLRYDEPVNYEKIKLVEAFTKLETHLYKLPFINTFFYALEKNSMLANLYSGPLALDQRQKDMPFSAGLVLVSFTRIGNQVCAVIPVHFQIKENKLLLVFY